ncbi:multidrug ABC transporter permease/ATP-binding protein [Pectobacterium cacticida]|uniref:multidrug ABC transporter permease/ATP-binding protein n=1 Tax=Pectobacterium cacticida TaxID=69221 RepID=UPI003987F724
MLKSILKKHQIWIVKVVVSSIAASLFGIAVLKFINQYLLQATLSPGISFLFFILLVTTYFLVSTYSQKQLTALGHQIVYELRSRLFKQILDCDLPLLKSITKPKIMASLSNDIQHISYAFVRMPELLQGGLFVMMICIYMCYMSPAIFVIVMFWIIVTLIVGNWSVKKVYHHLDYVRESENRIYKNYESAYDGFKELALNRHRAHVLYDEFLHTSADHRDHVISADNYHSFAGNFTNVMMLGAVGIIFYLSVYLGWEDITVATTIAVALLFARTPLISAVGAFPAILQAKVSIKAIKSLNLPPWEEILALPNPVFSHWSKLQLRNVSYTYGTGDHFALKHVNLTLKRGDVIFVVGKNGSGKSTLSMILAGLYTPTAGEILIDGEVITDDNRIAYRQLFSSVFTDFYLFSQIIDGNGKPVSPKLIDKWLSILEIAHKVKINDGCLSNTLLSQGQRKRLGLLISAVESKQIMILDEWAADQDPNFRKVFYEKILPILKKQGYTIFLISHDDKYFHHADRIIKMENGELLTCKTDYFEAI